MIEGLSAFRAADKLRNAGITVLSLKKQQKNAVIAEVASKDLEKVFAILRGSCYNIKKIRFYGLSKAWKMFCLRAGLLAGALIGVAAVCFFQTRVLRVEFTGSGAYYAGEVREILLRGGVKRFGPCPEGYAAVEAEILSLPRVSFCSVREDGGILTVEIQVSDDAAAIAGRPLTADADGIVEELTVIRGTAAVSVGDSVHAGDTLVDSSVGGAIVIARALVAYPFSREYETNEEEARAQALLECGTLREINAQKTDRGWLISGTGVSSVSVNLD